MDFKISYAITACNEHDELTELLAFVAEYKRPLDEIVIQVDSDAVTDEVKNVYVITEGNSNKFFKLLTSRFNFFDNEK